MLPVYGQKCLSRPMIHRWCSNFSEGRDSLIDEQRPGRHVVATNNDIANKILPHPPYSPDLAPSDYHLFGPMKKMLGGLRFTSDLEAQTVVHEWLAQQPASFFAEGIQKLIPRWDKCLNIRGGYVEK